MPIDSALRETARNMLEKFSADPNPALRSNALEALQRSLGETGSRAVVLRGLSDESIVVRFAACIAVGDLKMSDVKPVLLKLAYDPDANVRLAARYALHKLGDTALTQEMLLGLRDDRPGVRGNTVLLLGMLGEKSAILPLRRLLRDRATAVRLQTVEALWRLGDNDSLEALVSLTISRYPDEQIVALLALAQPRNRRALEHVRGLLVTEFPEVELAAARAAGMLGADDGYGVALKYFDSKESLQRSLSALALGEIGRSDAQEVLQKLLTDKSPTVQLSAASAILKLRAPGK